MRQRNLKKMNEWGFGGGNDMKEWQAADLIKRIKVEETADKYVDRHKAFDLAIKALEEIQQYREIGTIEELRELKESNLSGLELAAIAVSVEKLKKYEDMEKQGKLLRLPCVVGDIIYVIPSKTNYKLNILNGHKENNRVYQQEVNRIEIFRDGYLLSTCDGMQSVIDKFYKETWFLTKEEAEAELKKMGG